MHNNNQAGEMVVFNAVNAPEETVRQLIKELLILSSGTITLRVIKTLGPFGVSILMAQQGSDVLPAVTIINTVEAATSVIFNSPLYYLPTVIGEAIDQEHSSQVGCEAQAGWFVGALCGVPQVAIMLSLKEILSAMGQSVSVIKNSSSFFNIYVIGVGILSLQSASDQVVVATKNYKLPILTQLSSWLLTVGLSYGLGFGKLGLPNVGIRGPAYAMMGRAYVNSVLFHMPLVFSEKYKPYELFKKHPDFLKSLKRQLLNGGLLLCAFSALTGSSFFIGMLVGKFGAPSLAAQLVISQYSELLLVAPAAVGSAVQIAVANNKKSNPQKIKKYGHIGSALSLIPSMAYIGFMTFGPRILTLPFLDPSNEIDQAAIDILEGDNLFYISGGSVVLNTVCMVLGSALMGANKLAFPTILGMLFNWLGMGIGYGLANDVIELNIILLLCQLVLTLSVCGYWGKQNFIDDSQASDVQVEEVVNSDEVPLDEETRADMVEAPLLTESPRNLNCNRYGSIWSVPELDQQSNADLQPAVL